MRDGFGEIADALGLDAPPTPPDPPPSIQVQVNPGDNFASLVEQAAPGSIFYVSPEFVGDAFEFTKPLTMVPFASSTSTGIPAGRTTVGYIGPTLKILRGETLRLSAPGITLAGIRILGTHSEDVIMHLGDRSILDRCLVYGSEQGAHRGVAVDDAVGARMYGCYVGNIWHTIDTQAIGASSGVRDFMAANCTLEASGEVILLGGGNCASESAIPRQIRLDNLTLTRPMSWRGRTDLKVKNLFELKNAVDVQFTNSLLENCWQSGQDGYAIVLTVRNQTAINEAGDGEGENPFATVQDVLLKNLTVKNASAAVNILGRDDTIGKKRFKGERLPSVQMSRVLFEDISFDNINADEFGGIGRGLFVQGGPADLTWRRVSIRPQGSFAQFLCLGGKDNALLPWQLERFTMEDCELPEGDYGIFAEGGILGAAALDAYAPGGYTWQRNTVVKYPNGRTINYPAGTTVVGA